MDIITRSQALAQGLRQYYTGKPCKRGHLSERSTNKSMCLECDRLRKALLYQDPVYVDRLNTRRRRRYANDFKHRAAELARNAKRRSWVCTDDMENTEAIDAIYEERDHMSEFLDVPMHVDHITPVTRGGEHHENNLQIIPAATNLAKGARTDWQPEPNSYEQITYRTTRGHKK